MHQRTHFMYYSNPYWDKCYLKVWQKSPTPSSEQGTILRQIYAFHEISYQLGSGGRKGPHLQTGNCFKVDLLVSWNFLQVWFRRQKSPPPSFLWDFSFLDTQLLITLIIAVVVGYQYSATNRVNAWLIRVVWNPYFRILHLWLGCGSYQNNWHD